MNHWNSRFQKEDYVYGTEPNVFLEDIHKRFQFSGDILSIAEGEGRNAVFLAKQGFKMTAWDISETGLEKTRRLAKSESVEVKTEHVDLNNAQWEKDKWDALICIFGHFPTELRYKTLKGIKESTKPGGYFVAEVYSVYQLPYKSGGPKDKERLYKPEDFLTFFSDWRIVHFFMGEVIRNEGERHNGLSHVIQFVGQKK